MTQCSNNILTWQEISTVEQLLTIESKWQALNEKTTSEPLFNSPLWLKTWLATYWQPHWQLKVLVGWHDQELKVLLPLYCQTSGLLKQRVFYPLGAGEPEDQEIASEYLDILIASNFKDEAYRYIESWLEQQKIDQLIWRALPSTHHAFSLLTEASTQKSNQQACRFIINTKQWQISNLSKNTKKRWSRSKNQLAKLNASFTWLTGNDFQKHWPVLKELHQQRWQKRGKAGAFSSSKFTDFHLSLHKQNQANSQISAIIIDNKIIALNYYLKYGDKLYFYQSGWDQQNYAHCAPGLALHIWSISNTKASYYDFMMAGLQHSYKAKFGAEQQPMNNLTLDYHPLKNKLVKVLNKLA